MKNAIAETGEKLDILKRAESQVQEQFKKGEVSEEQYRALKREIEKTSLELADFEEAARQTQQAIKELGEKTKLSGEDLENAQEKAGELSDKLDAMKDAAQEAAAVLGTAFVGAATYATKFETECDQALNTVITQTGATNAEVEGLEETLLNIYKNNFGEDINDIAVAMSTVKQQTGLADEELQKTTETAILMRDTFDVDINESIRGVNAMMKQFGIDADTAYNLIAQGAQKGLNQNGDLADQLAEYATYYNDLGFSAEEAFNMMANGVQNGTFQLDYLNDAVKEFGIRVKDGTADDSFKELGLNAEELKQKFAEGGKGAREAFDIVNQALFSCDDEVQRNLLGVSLYGTKWEDLGEDAIKALTNTKGEISATNDALGAINEQKYNDLGSQFEELGRTINTDLVKPLGEELQPIVSDVIQTVKDNIPEVKELVVAVVDKVSEFVNFVSANGPVIISIIAGIAAGMLAWNVVSMIQGLIGAFQVWRSTTEGMTIAQQLLNTVMAANPIGIIITAITALIAVFTTLFLTNEDFRNKVIEIWEKVKETAINVFGAIADFFTIIIPEAINVVIEFFQGLWDSIVSIFEGVGQWFSDRFNEAYTGITNIFAAIGSWFAARWNDITNALAAVATWFHTMFSNDTTT